MINAWTLFTSLANASGKFDTKEQLFAFFYSGLQCS